MAPSASQETKKYAAACALAKALTRGEESPRALGVLVGADGSWEAWEAQEGESGLAPLARLGQAPGKAPKNRLENLAIGFLMDMGRENPKTAGVAPGFYGARAHEIMKAVKNLPQEARPIIENLAKRSGEELPRWVSEALGDKAPNLAVERKISVLK